jgi:CheY-like chemotaxis protein
MPYVFDPFRQEFGSQRGYSEGSGLGMSITKRLVELLRGTIQVTSASGAGSTFTVRFSGLTTDADDTAPSADPRVLILADRPDTRKLLGLLLEDRVALELTADLEEALSAAKRERYTLVLIDVNALRDPSGVEALSTLRTLPNYESIPFVAVTAHVMPGERRSLLADGFDDVLPKPFSKSALLELLGRHIPGL